MLDESLTLSYFDGYVQDLIRFLNEIQNLQSKLPRIDKIFTIPKNYPWPQKEIY